MSKKSLVKKTQSNASNAKSKLAPKTIKNKTDSKYYFGKLSVRSITSLGVFASSVV